MLIGYLIKHFQIVYESQSWRNNGSDPLFSVQTCASNIMEGYSNANVSSF